MLRKALFAIIILAGFSAASAQFCPTQRLPGGGQKPQKMLASTDTLFGFHHWYADTVYVLTGVIYVGDAYSDGNTFTTNQGDLTIDPGTIIKGQPGQGDQCKILLITRYSKIHAVGTQTCPIVFTSTSDDVDNTQDIPNNDFGVGRGLWGSLVLCGNAPINTPGDTNFIEGLSANPHTVYGGYDCHASSGEVEYVSLRHGGSILAPNNEINGLTMCGIGDGTTIDYVESFANNDDNFEWFGGDVNCKHLVGAFGDDDGFDWDQGYSGRMQFLFATYDSISNGDHFFEMDSDDPTFVGRPPFAKPIVYNWTIIGRGAINPDVGSVKEDHALEFKEDTGGHLRKGLALEANKKAFTLQDKDGIQSSFGDCATGSDDAEKRGRCFTSGSPDDTCHGNPAPNYAVSDIDVYSVAWWHVGATNSFPAELADGDKPWVNSRVADWVNRANTNFGQLWPNDVIADPGIKYGPCWREHNHDDLDPRPSASGIAYTMNAPQASQEDSWFQDVPYSGAFSSTDNWAMHWTAMWAYGYFPIELCGDANGDGSVNISDAVFLIQYIFAGGHQPIPYRNGDPNDDGSVNISDAVYEIQYIFAHGAAPQCPDPNVLVPSCP